MSKRATERILFTIIIAGNIINQIISKLDQTINIFRSKKPRLIREFIR